LTIKIKTAEMMTMRVTCSKSTWKSAMVVELFGNVSMLDELILVIDSFHVAGLQAHIYWLLKQHKATHPHHASTLVSATYFLPQPLSAHAQAATLVPSSHASLSATITAFSSCSTDLYTSVKRIRHAEHATDMQIGMTEGIPYQEMQSASSKRAIYHEAQQ